jgi:RHS repeat-associated protein
VCASTDPSNALMVHYSPEGRRADITRAGGSVTSVQTDNALRMLSFTQHFAVAGSDLTNTFGYNNASQITSLTQSNTQYNYAEAQNRTGTYTPNGLNQYTQVDGVTFTYDMENHLVATGGSKASSLCYDVLGRLSQYVVDNKTTQFLYDGDALVGEWWDGVHSRRYVHGDQVDEPLMQYNGSSVGSIYRRYLQSDHQRSIIAHSDTGGGYAKLSYDPYGIPGVANIDRFGYTGQTWLKEIGLDYYKARVYLPRVGRFLQGDPVFYVDDMNLYAYVYNDPINRSDPSGLDSVVKVELTLEQYRMQAKALWKSLTPPPPTQKGQVKSNTDVRSAAAKASAAPVTATGDVEAAADMRVLAGGISRLTSSAKIGGSSQSYERGLTMGRNANGIPVVTSLQVLGKQGGGIAGSRDPSTEAIAHVHYVGLMQPPNGGDNAAAKAGVPSFVFGAEFGSTWEVGLQAGAVMTRTIAGDGTAGPWRSY